MILPPVAAKDDMADSRVGSNVGSGFLFCEKSVGSDLSKETMTDLPHEQSAIQNQITDSL